MYSLQELPWVDVRDALKVTKIAYIPVGAVEVDGPYLPQGTDGIVADYFAKELAKIIPAFLVPLIPVGVVPESDDFPITLTVSPTSLRNYLQDICDSLVKHGIEKIVFVTGHRTNVAPIQEIMVNLRDQGVPSVTIFTWDLFFSMANDLIETGKYAKTHAGELCTSVIMAINDNLVPKGRFSFSEPKTEIGTGNPGIFIYQKFSDLSEDGAVGDGSYGTIEKGEILLKRGLELAVEFIRSYFDLY